MSLLILPPSISYLDNIRHYSYAWCYVVKKQFIIQNKLQYRVGLKYVEDSLFVNQMFFWSAEFVSISDPMYYYRANPRVLCTHLIRLNISNVR